MDVRHVVAETDAELRIRGTSDRAEHEKAYLKSELEHDGTTVPGIRLVAKTLSRRYPELGHDDLVDGLAASVVGGLAERDPELAAVLDRWAVDDDFWIRRSALLALLPGLRRGAGDFERFSRYADAMLEEKEFFVRKAIGWVLRDTAKKRPTTVYEWLLPRAGRASGITVREAVKPLSEQQRASILAAR